MKNENELSHITFIGAGNMATSLIGGLIANQYDPHKIWATNPTPKKLNFLKQKFNVHTTTDNLEGTKQGDIIILAVKPQVIKEVSLELASLITEKKPLLMSIAAGIRVNCLEQWMGSDVAIVRCMPNTPALVSSGATALYANSKVSSQQKQQAESIMRAVGLTIWIGDESHMDIVTALSGSGPAYFFMVMEALEKAATQLGLPKDIAHLLTLQTALGAAKMALECHEEIAQLRQQVTSPKGTTEAALTILEQGNIFNLFDEAIKAAYERSRMLAQTLSVSD